MTLNGINIGDQVYAVDFDQHVIYHSYVEGLSTSVERNIIKVANGPAFPAECVFRTLESAQSFILANTKMVEVEKKTLTIYVGNENDSYNFGPVEVPNRAK